MKLNPDEIAVLYYYHVNSDKFKFTDRHQDAYVLLLAKIRDIYERQTKPPTPNKVWEALKGVVG